MIDYNLNHYVRVRLTEHGLNILHNDFRNTGFDELPKYVTPDANGFIVLQLWEIMQIFGAHMGNGRVVPFETTIQLLGPDSHYE